MAPVLSAVHELMCALTIHALPDGVLKQVPVDLVIQKFGTTAEVW
jgi:hypothetical protein